MTAHDDEDSDDDVHEPLDGPSVDAGFAQRFLEQLTTNEAGLSSREAYTSQALSVLHSLSMALGSDTAKNAASEDAGIVYAADDLNEVLADTVNILKTQQRASFSPPAPIAPEKVLCIDYSATGHLQARVEWIAARSPSASELAEIEQYNKAMKDNSSPPYVRMPPDASGRPQAPSEEQTIALFHLCEEQALAFRIIARVLRAEIVGLIDSTSTTDADPLEQPFLPTCAEPDRPLLAPQLLMVLLGGAGK